MSRCLLDDQLNNKITITMVEPQADGTAGRVWNWHRGTPRCCKFDGNHRAGYGNFDCVNTELGDLNCFARVKYDSMLSKLDRFYVIVDKVESQNCFVLKPFNDFERNRIWC